MNSAFLPLWLALCVVITYAKDPMEDPEYRAIIERQNRILNRYLERKALGDFQIIPLQINGRSISEELRDLMELQVVKVFGLPSDFDDNLPVETSTVTKRSGKPAVEWDSSEKDEESNSNHPRQVGSIRGIPGVHFPDYTDIPITSFTCADKPHLPGFYADLDTGCQVFHVCWNDRRETFLCPLGTTFNQALLTCDYWYSSNCSLALHYYNVNEGKKFDVEVPVKDDLRSTIDVFLGLKTNESKSNHVEEEAIPASVLAFVKQFMPVKAKVTIYPESDGQPYKIVASASVGSDKKSTRKLKSLRTTEVPSTEGTSPISTDWSSKVQTCCNSYRHFAYRLDKKFEEILPWLKKPGSANFDLDWDITEIRKFLRNLDPEFDKFDISKASYDTEKHVQDFMHYLSSMAKVLFTSTGVIPTTDFNQSYDPVSEGDYGILEMILNKIRKFSLMLNPSLDPEKTSDAGKLTTVGGFSSDSSSTTKYDGVSTTTPVTPKSVEAISRCKKPKCGQRSKPTLTPVNPRFITKPVAPKKVAAVKVEPPQPLRKSKVSESFESAKSSVLHSSSKRIAVSEETKKALLSNYMKLLKIEG